MQGEVGWRDEVLNSKEKGYGSRVDIVGGSHLFLFLPSFLFFIRKIETRDGKYPLPLPYGLLALCSVSLSSLPFL